MAFKLILPASICDLSTGATLSFHKVSLVHHALEIVQQKSEAHSGGLAGSMITDCLVGSSVTR